MDYNKRASDETIQATTQALAAGNFTGEILETKQEALDRIKQLIPAGASVMNGASRTLEQIGFVDYLKNGRHGWNNLHEAILAEKDPAKQAALRKQSVISDYYLGSVHALTKNGEMIIASNTGSQLPHLVYTSQNLILVVGSQKIVEDIPDGLKRIAEYVVPLEDQNMRTKYGVGTRHNKTVILHGENPMSKRTITVLIVKEILGF